MSLIRFLDSLSNRPLVISIRRGLTLMIPFMIMGSFAVFINNLPIHAYQDLMVRIIGENWKSFGDNIHSGTFAIMAVGMLLTISYSMASISPRALQQEVNPMIASIVSLACLFATMHVENGFLNVDWLGPLGVFLAIVIACLSVNIFIFLSTISWLKVKVYSNAAEPIIAQAMSALLPALGTVALFALLHSIMADLGIPDIYAAMNVAIKNTFVGMSSSLFTALIFVILIHVSWFFGIHGNNALEPVTQSLFVPALTVNQHLVAQGYPPTEIFTKQFFDVFVFLGGSGATLCLIAAILISLRRSNTKQIALISTLPSIFNVNELMVFGVPIAFNFYLLIPFVILPALLTIITFFAMAWGLVPFTIASVDWTTPILLGGYMATNSVAGSLLQLFNFLVGILVYLPFIRMHEKHLAQGEEETMQNLLHEVSHLMGRREMILLNRRDSVGNMARFLVSDLEYDLRNGKIKLEYQPRVNAQNHITGMEALLRWRHDHYGLISPPIAIALAEETGLIHGLGIWIIRTACRQFKKWNDEGLTDLSLSINLTPTQLDDTTLPYQINSVLLETGIQPHQIELEITEQAALGGFKRLTLLNEIKEMGLHLAMDDFGMGHSSLIYLKEFNLDTVKLDGSLVREVLTNDKCKEIINSIVNLCRSMEINVIAEYVETEAQQKALLALGCSDYQGFLYSPALPPDELMKFYLAHQGNDSIVL
ncbi:MAG TPA: EAL domain-containing protein [Syntrophomonadaceae bacterium]|nr:EAL domain-containing protein [Syntrophomonadaceae bacterium]